MDHIVEAGAHGDMRAIQAVFALQHRYKDSTETTLDPEELDPEDRQIVDEYLSMVRTSGPGTESNKEHNENKTGDSQPTEKANSALVRPSSGSGTSRPSPINWTEFAAARSNGSSSTCRRAG